MDEKCSEVATVCSFGTLHSCELSGRMIAVFSCRFALAGALPMFALITMLTRDPDPWILVAAIFAAMLLCALGLVCPIAECYTAQCMQPCDEGCSPRMPWRIGLQSVSGGGVLQEYDSEGAKVGRRFTIDDDDDGRDIEEALQHAHDNYEVHSLGGGASADL